MLEPTVIGKWKKERELGSGGFGVVSLWVNNSTKEYLAIKKCNRLCASELSQKQADRWKMEVRTMQEIDHENIVQFRPLPSILQIELNKYNPSRLPILSLEYCSMGNLRDALMKPQNSCGFSEDKVIDILHDSSRALQYLHEKNITHRDFKPENIVLQPSATRRNGVTYKIIDLGYAKEINSGTVSFVGTMQYLAPEIFEYQHYSNSVDYWSFGVTAFEVICGIRPFLPTLLPIASFQHVKDKQLDVISIQFTHTGDIDFSTKLLEENWLTLCLNTKITKWLRSVLQYNPENRGLMEGGVFDSLKTTISTKMITVFCVYTYEFYSYEITETTQFTTLVENICNDVQLNPNEFYIVPTKTIANVKFAMDCYDEMNREAMLFIIHKHAGFKTNIRAIIPSMIKVIVPNNMNAELDKSTTRQLYAQTNYFVIKEEKNLKMLKESICFLSDFMKNNFEMKKKLFAEVKLFLESYLSEIEFYNKMESSLFPENYKTKNNAKLDQLLLNHKFRIMQLDNIIKVVNNDLLVKDKDDFIQFDKFEKLANDLIDHLGTYNFNDLKLKASKLLEMFYDNPTTQIMKISPVALQIITNTIKLRDKLMNDAPLANFLSCASNYNEELSKFIMTLNKLRVKQQQIKEDLRNVMIEIWKIVKDFDCNTRTEENVEQVLNENDLLLQKIENMLFSASLEFKNIICEVNNELDFMIQDSEM